MKKPLTMLLVAFVWGCQDQAGLTSSSPASPGGTDAQAVVVTGALSNHIVARNDFYRAVQGEALIVSPPGVLRNDMVPAGVVVSPEFVVATLPPTSFDNTGNGGFILDLSDNPALSGPLSFDYFFRTAAGTSNIATVTVQVAPSGRPPIARNDSYRVVQGGTLIVSPPGVLRNDMVPAGVVASVEFVVATLPPTSFTNTGTGGFILDLSDTPALSGPLSFDYLFHTPAGDSNIGTVTVQVTH